MTKMTDMRIYGKNRKANELESWYAALGTEVLPSLFNNDPGMAMSYQGQIWSVVLLYGTKVKQCLFFSETTIVYDIKIGRCSQLNEYMKFYEYQKSRSFIDLGPNHIDSIF